MLIAGFLYIAGKIIPGISSSFFLMILGLYDYILNIMSNPFSLTFIDLIKLIPFIIGIIIGFIVLIKLINKLLSNYFVKTYSSIIGFVLGSIIAIYPGFKFNLEYILSILIMICSFSLVYKISQK
jgi:putative membrane protein